jgi:beta-phosphoglucomutase-like phosphatase (HAD superfamily)
LEPINRLCNRRRIVLGDLAVIFDMDGVIVDSEPVYRRLNKSIFKELDIKVDEDTQLSFIGGTTRRKWTILKEKFSLSQSVE